MRLCLNNISVSFGDNTVLNNINMEINSKDKVAIVGRNGSGKTTLLRVITGEQDIDFAYQGNIKDKIQKTGKFDIGYLKQIAFEDDSETLEEELLKVYKDIIKLKEKIEALEKTMQDNAKNQDFEKYEELCAKYDLMGGYTYLKEYNTALKKFGFSEDDKKKRLNEFSGGQRTKIALIKLLLGKPDLLILDEPTNHLDINSIRWLEEYLDTYPKAILVVSHDRAFLDKFVNVVYEIERSNITRYVGNYSQFVKTKELNFEKQLKDYEAYTKEKARLQAVADRFRYKATKASMAQSKLKAIEKMGDMENPQGADARVFNSNIEPMLDSGNDVLIADNIEIGYDRVLTKISFKIFKGDKVGVVGGNGLGKSTLLKSLVGKVKLLGGKVKFGTNVDIGYFDQQSATNNVSSDTVLENFLKDFPQEDTQSARSILGSFCFTQDDVFKTINNLSGGEKVRLELCKILRKRPNFLILDEPTNHMDIMGKEALEKALMNYTGTLLFVSHDRYFVNKLASHLIVFENGGGKYLKDTTYSEYEKREKESANNSDNIYVNKRSVSVVEKKEKPNEYLLNKERARNDAKRKKLENKINEIESIIGELKTQIESPEICSDYLKIMELQESIDNKNSELEKLMEEWLLLS